MKCVPRYHLTEMQRLRNKGEKATFVFLIRVYPIRLISARKLDCVGGKVFRGPSWSRSAESLVLVDWPWFSLPFKLYNLPSNAISDGSIGSLSECFQMFLCFVIRPWELCYAAPLCIRCSSEQWTKVCLKPVTRNHGRPWRTKAVHWNFFQSHSRVPLKGWRGVGGGEKRLRGEIWWCQKTDRDGEFHHLRLVLSTLLWHSKCNQKFS